MRTFQQRLFDAILVVINLQRCIFEHQQEPKQRAVRGTLSE